MRYATFFSLLLFSTALQGQNDKALLRELAEENKKSVDALALYPSETRLAILVAAQYPEALIKMNDARVKTAAAFRTLIEDFPRATQTIFYDLARYPVLLQELSEKQESPAAVREALEKLPEPQRSDAFDAVQDHSRTLLKINELNRTAHDAFENMISAYPTAAQLAFRRLVELPETLEILNQDLRFTVLVGDVYRADPAWVIQKTDSLNLAVARAHAQELDEWKKTIENDPQAQQELETASREYATEYGYDLEKSSGGNGDDLYYGYDDYPPHTVAAEYYYPWWFGYPWWYPAPCWRPYPWWYNWGFYHHHHAFVVVYMPSWHFMDWYFYHPHHHNHYSHLSAHFVHHYYGHRRSSTSISTGVSAWRDRNRAILSDEWLNDKTRLPERLKNYGRFEEERQQYNARNPKNPVSQEVFLGKNAHRYPELERARAQAAEEMKRERDVSPARPSEWAPRKEPVPDLPKTEPSQKPKTERPPRVIQPPVREKPRETPQRPDTQKPQDREPEKPRPEDYHRRTWNETRRSETPAQRPSTPPPAAKPQPRKSEPKPKNEPQRKN